MKSLPWCTVLLLTAALVPAAAQDPVVGPGIATPQPTAPLEGAQAPKPATARIRGRVVRADTGAPLRGAQVTLGGDLFRRATTDDQGRYDFAELPAGRYSLQAAHGGYVTLNHGQRRANDPGRPIALAAAQAMENIDFTLPRGSVITGRITDEFGEPVTGLEIRIERHQYVPGGRQLATFPMGTALTLFQLMTNDLGEFRVFGLMPGEYVLSARPRQLGPDALTSGADAGRDPAETFRPTYYPGTTSVGEAQPIRVGISQEVAASFSVASGRMVRISGTVVDSAGRPAAGMSLRLRSETATSASAANAGTVAADGSFTIGNVAPGEYVLEARPAAPGPGAEVATLPVSVATEDLSDVHIAMRAGTLIRGRLEWEGSAPRPTGNIRVDTTSAEFPRRGPTGEFTFTYLNPTNGTVNDDDTFELDGIIGRVLFRTSPLPSPWSVKAVFADGADITDTGADAASLGGDTRIRMVLTDRLTEISGTVRNGRGESVADYVVVLLPEQPMDGGTGIRFTRTVRPDQAGAFRLRGLPAGRYVAAAVDGLEQGGEWNPAFQKVVRDAGESFRLAEGQALTLALELMQ